MNTFTIAIYSVLLLAIVGCSSSLESRLKQKPDVFASLDPATQQSVRLGQVKEGFSKDAVLLAWGRPSKVEPASPPSSQMERWHYTRMKTVPHPERLVTRMSGGGRRGIAHATMFDRVKVPGPILEFSGGKVVRILPASEP